MKKTLYLWVDDVRNLPEKVKEEKYDMVLWAKTSQRAIGILHDFHKDFDIIIDFDHDLGGWSDGTGYDIAKYIVENQIQLHCFSVHSANPVGAFNITQLLQHYGYLWL